MSRRTNQNHSATRGITFFESGGRANQGADYAANWYAANTILKSKASRIIAVVLGIGFLIGAVDNLRITIPARELARERIVYHPAIGYMHTAAYDQLTRSLFTTVGVLVVLVAVMRILAYRHLRNWKVNRFAK